MSSDVILLFDLFSRLLLRYKDLRSALAFGIVGGYSGAAIITMSIVIERVYIGKGALKNNTRHEAIVTMTPEAGTRRPNTSVNTITNTSRSTVEVRLRARILTAPINTRNALRSSVRCDFVSATEVLRALDTAKISSTRSWDSDRRGSDREPKHCVFEFGIYTRR